VFNQHSGEGAYAFVDQAANGAGVFRANRGGAAATEEAVVLSASTLNTLAFTYDKTNGDATFTLTDGASVVHTCFGSPSS
jgi:hypothetical protein